MILKIIISISIARLSLSNAMVQEIFETPEPSYWQVLLQLNNDLFAGSDRDYTNSVRVGFMQDIQ